MISLRTKTPKISFSLAKYYWQTGVYDLDDMKKLVYQKHITKQEYEQITRKKDLP